MKRRLRLSPNPPLDPNHMKKIILANRDYDGSVPGSKGHVTDEGAQRQNGLAACGWRMAGCGCDIDETDVEIILRQCEPDIIFIQDPRDWCTDNPGLDRWIPREIAFTNIEALKDYPAFKVVVMKDAGTAIDFQRQFAEKVGANALNTYYHDLSVIEQAPWTKDYVRIREHHTIDGTWFKWPTERKRGVVSGARNSNVYPLRSMAFQHAGELGIDMVQHPGYHNRGSKSEDYKRMLAGYKVSVATASRYGFSLRKIIESVAAGCVVVTDLPEYDVMPVFDDALVRVPRGADIEYLREAISLASVFFDARMEEGLIKELSEKTRQHYDWRASGERLDAAILKAEAAWRVKA